MSEESVPTRSGIMEIVAKRLLATATSATGKKKIDLFYDVLSPYTWFAFETLMRYKNHWNIEVTLKPMLLAGVNQATGNKPPGLVPNKAVYMNSDLARCATYFNVPLKMPEDPFDMIMVKGSLIPNRFLTAIDMLHPEHLEAATRALWMSGWSRGEDFTQPAILAKAGQTAGLSNDQLLKIQEHMTQQATKDRLRAYTDQAVQYGAFGSPTIIYHKDGSPQLFFGSDRFPVLAQEIGEEWRGPQPDSADAKL
ncbi:glutathione S-transferase kappa 1-like [Penaeus monodon]|uniref:glutathione S-transferase kappa 1-like n=1 Tax=Penaeus monodon TaxID=6687 RepID=UPI0018A738BB|nr:glutathione S-transferase kappa 1-like [Penaeus monodon]